MPQAAATLPLSLQRTLARIAPVYRSAVPWTSGNPPTVVNKSCSARRQVGSAGISQNQETSDPVHRERPASRWVPDPELAQNLHLARRLVADLQAVPPVDLWLATLLPALADGTSSTPSYVPVLPTLVVDDLRLRQPEQLLWSFRTEANRDNADRPPSFRQAQQYPHLVVIQCSHEAGTQAFVNSRQQDQQ